MGEVTFNIIQPQLLNLKVEQKVIGLKIINKTEGLIIQQSKVGIVIKSSVVDVEVVQKPAIEMIVTTMGAQGLRGVQGLQGFSPYSIALNNGFVGTESQWLLSLKGENSNVNGGYF